LVARSIVKRLMTTACINREIFHKVVPRGTIGGGGPIANSGEPRAGSMENICATWHILPCSPLSATNCAAQHMLRITLCYPLSAIRFPLSACILPVGTGNPSVRLRLTARRGGHGATLCHVAQLRLGRSSRRVVSFSERPDSSAPRFFGTRILRRPESSGR